MPHNRYPEETVRLILDAAQRLFTQKGYDHTSIQDIIDATNLSKGAIYHHFVSKEDIFDKLAQRIWQHNEVPLKKIRDNPSLNGREKLKELFRASILNSNQQEILPMVPYLLDSPRFLAMQIKTIYDEVVPDYVEPILREGMADGSIAVEHPKELAEAILVLCNVWLHPMLQPTTPEEMRMRCEVFIFMMRGIGIDLLDNEAIEGYLQFSKVHNDRSPALEP